MSVLSTLTVKLEGEASSLLSTLGKSGGAVSGFVSGALKSLGGLESGFAKVGVAAGIGGAIAVAGLAVVGKQLYDLGAQYDEAYDIIIARTGASGSVLEGYKQTAKNVYGEVTNSLNEVATVESLLAVRTNLTGGALQGLTTTTLELAKVTKQEALPLADNLTRTFGAWNIATDQQSLAMDKMLKVSQTFGIELTELSTMSADTQAAFENLGFTFEEQITIFGKWKAEGVNIENVLAGFQQSVSRLTKPTENLIAALAPFPEVAKLVGDSTTPLPVKFNAVKDTLDTLFASGKPEDDAKAKEIIFETFGKRSLNNMVDLFKNKRLEIGDVLPTILDPGVDGLTHRTLMKTEDFGDKWTKAWHRVQNAVEPVASKVFDNINSFLEDFLEGDKGTKGKFHWEDLGGGVQKKVWDVKPRLPKPSYAETIHDWFFGTPEQKKKWHWEDKGGGVQQLMVDKPFRPEGKGVADSFQEDFLDPMNEKWDSFLRDFWWPIEEKFHEIRELFNDMLNEFTAFWSNLMQWKNNITGAFVDAVSWLWQAGVDIIQGLWNGVLWLWTGGLEQWFFGIGLTVISWVGDALVWLWQKGVDLVQGLWNGALGWLPGFLGWIGGIGLAVIGWIGDALSWLWQKGVDLAQGLWNGASGKLGEFLGWVAGIAGAVLGWIGDVASTLWQKGVDLLQGLVNGAGAVALGIHGWLLDHVFTPIVNFFSDAWHWLFDAGVGIVQGLVDGILSLKDKVVDGANKLKDWITSPFSGSPIISGPLYDAGIEVGHALTSGIVAGMAAGKGPVGTAAEALKGAVVPPIPVVPPGLAEGVPPTTMLPAPEETQAVADTLGGIQQGWADASLATAFGTTIAALAVQDNFDANTVQKTADTQALANAIWAQGMFTMLGTTTSSLDALNATTQSHFFTLSMLTQSTMSNVVQTMTTGANTAADSFVAALAARIPPLQFTLSSYAENVKAYGRSYLTAIGAPVTFARGGLMGPGSENHQPMISPGGTLRVWSEPETGGEAYIPLGLNKRMRSEKILGTVASMFGMGLVPFAEGGLTLAELFWESASGTDWKNGVDIGRTIGGHTDHAHAANANGPWQLLDAYLQSVGIAPGPGSTTGGQHAAGSYHYRGQAKDYGTAANGGIPGVDRIYQAFLALVGGGGAFSAIPMPDVPGLPDFGPGIPAEQARIMAFFMRQSMQKKLEDARTAMLASMGGGSYPGGGSGPYKDYAMSLFGKYGWGPDQWSPLEQLVGKESGWNPNAINPSSGAWGLFQFLGKGPFDPDPYSQIWRGLEYIAGRYGNPAAAWNFWLGHNWYGEGGILGAMGGAKLADSGVNLDPGWNSVFNGTGAIEELRPTPDADSLRPIEVHVHPSPGMDEEALARLTRRELEKVESDRRFRGGSRR